jgi:integrase
VAGVRCSNRCEIEERRRNYKRPTAIAGFPQLVSKPNKYAEESNDNCARTYDTGYGKESHDNRERTYEASTDSRIEGWHMLRHSYTTLLRQHNSDWKVVPDLVRHASQRMTQNVYGAAISDDKQAANSKVVRLLSRSRSSELATKRQSRTA